MLDDESNHKILIDVNGIPFNGNLIRELRLRRPYSKVITHKTMSKEQVARKIGVHEQQILRWERYPVYQDTRCPRSSNLKKLALFFQIDPNALLGLMWLVGDTADRFCREEVSVEIPNNYCECCGRYVGDEQIILDKWSEVK